MFKLKTLTPAIQSFNANRYFWLSTLLLVALMIAEPAQAQAWAEKTKSIADDIVKGLRYLCYPIATGTAIWIVIQIWTGSKRLQDMMHWIVGAALLIAIPELVNLIPK